MAQRFNLGEAAGVVVVGVESDSKGSGAGVQVGDIIKEINHQVTETVKDYTASVQKIKTGESVNLFIWRKNAGFLIIKFNK
jgi:S1-C subfamily serine protease